MPKFTIAIVVPFIIFQNGNAKRDFLHLKNQMTTHYLVYKLVLQKVCINRFKKLCLVKDIFLFVCLSACLHVNKGCRLGTGIIGCWRSF